MVDGSTDLKPRRFPWLWVGVVLHILLVAFFAFVMFASRAPITSDDANIGAGLARLPVVALGFPWSFFVFEVRAAGDHNRDVMLTFAAIMNVALNALIIRLLGKKLTG